MNFIKKHKVLLTILILLLAIVLIITINNKKKGLNSLESAPSDIMSKISSFFYGGANRISNGFKGLFSKDDSKSKIKELEEKVSVLEDKNRQLETVIMKSSYLKKEYNLLKNTKYDLIKAKIASMDPDEWYKRFTINKGSKDGVKDGDIVIGASEIQNNVYIEGLLGKITDASKDSSRVISLNDDKFKVSFNILRNNESGVVGGTFDSEIEGYMFDSNADVLVGDKLITSSSSDEYPPNIYLGEVVEVINDESNLKKIIKVKAAVDIKDVSNVFIIKR